MSFSEHSKSESERSYENSHIEEEEESENESNSENFNEEEDENFSGEESENNSEQSDPDILNSEDDAESLSDDFETQLKKFNNKKLVEKNEIKFDIPKEKSNKYITIAKKSDKNNSNLIENSGKENSAKSLDSVMDKFVAFKILNDVNSNLDKLERELNENLKKLNKLKNDDKQKEEKHSNGKKGKFEDDLSEDEESSDEKDKRNIQKKKKFIEKEVNTDVVGSRTAGNFGNNFKESLHEINQNYSGNSQKSKNFERNRYSNNSNNHFRTIEDLYRNPYQNTQPIIYNRDNNNYKNSKSSQMNFNHNKYNSKEDFTGSQDNFIKIQKKNRPQNITQAVDILLNKNSELEQRKDV